MTARRCGHPGEVANGKRDGSIFIYPNRVTYTCFEGYELTGRPYRICQANGQWSGTLPVCRREYDVTGHDVIILLIDVEVSELYRVNAVQLSSALSLMRLPMAKFMELITLTAHQSFTRVTLAFVWLMVSQCEDVNTTARGRGRSLHVQVSDQ